MNFEKISSRNVLRTAVAAVAFLGPLALDGCSLPSDKLVTTYDRTYDATYNACGTKLLHDMRDAGAPPSAVEEFKNICRAEADRTAQAAVNN